MNNIETYKYSTEIEFFLRRVLKVKLGSRDEQTLKGFYESLVLYENGHSYMCSPKQHQARIQRLVKYFDKAIDKLSKKYPDVISLKGGLSSINCAAGILSVYQQLKTYEE